MIDVILYEAKECETSLSITQGDHNLNYIAIYHAYRFRSSTYGGRSKSIVNVSLFESSISILGWRSASL